MKTQKLRLLFAGITPVFLLGLSGCNFFGSDGIIPKDWYILPESGLTGANFTDPSTQGKLGKYVNHLVELNSKAIGGAIPMSEVAPSAPTAPLPGYPADWVPWHLSMIKTEFAISSEGILAPIVLGGKASVETIWKYRENRLGGMDKDSVKSSLLGTKKGFGPVSVQTPVVMKVSGSATSRQIERELEAPIRAALNTGKIRNELNFRNAIGARARDFRAIAARLQVLAEEQEEWRAEEFRLIVAIDAEGNVTPLNRVGGEVFFRFEWVPSEEEGESPMLSARDTANSKLASSLEGLVRAVRPDLKVLLPQAEAMTEAGLKFEGFRLGLAISVEGEIGVAKAGGSVEGVIKFEKAEEGHEGPKLLAGSELGASDSIRVIDSKAKPEHFRLADTAGVPHRDYFQMNGLTGSSQAVYHVSHTAFREGLKRAMAMGSFFAKHARTSPESKWGVKEIACEFELSLEGSVGLVTVEGEAAVEIMFEDPAL